MCEQELFEFANQVVQLSQHFPCEKGFATVSGPDIPNYVVEQTDQYGGRCGRAGPCLMCPVYRPRLSRPCDATDV